MAVTHFGKKTYRRLRLPMAVITLAIPLSCSRSEGTLQSLDGSEDSWAKRAWLDKTARLLRYGEGISPSDDVPSLMALPREDIVDRLMEDSRFLDMTLDFNLFFLGFKAPKLTVEVESTTGSQRQYLNHVYSFPQAIHATQAVANGGDYFSLLDYEQPLYLDRFERPSIEKGDGSSEQLPKGTPEDEVHKVRIAAILKALEIHDSLTALFDPQHRGSKTLGELCQQASELQTRISNQIDNAGLNFAMDLIFTFNYFSINLDCAAKVDVDHFAMLQQLRDTYAWVLKLADSPAASSSYSTPTPAQIYAAEFPRSKLGPFAESPFSFQYWQALPNSSTNYNRKRAAYVLSTYFCDDLTPVNVAMPDHGTDNRHGHDPACASCHYKLDPMAGFFRNNAVLGLDTSRSSAHVFDDNQILIGAKKEHYLDSWRAAPNEGRSWNVGYIRSMTQEARNSYGETLPDLHKILREAPEVRLCLTKKLAQYVIGKNQIFDGGWLHEVAGEFDAAARASDRNQSSQAFKTAVKKLVLSQAFSTPDPQAKQCYDFPQGKPASALPCEISFNISSNCASCHSGSSAMGGLDLTTWQKMANSDEMSFAHVDDSGHPIAKAVTMERIVQRLSATDINEAMPLRKFMDANDRAQLFQWANSEMHSTPGVH